ncbi:MAG: gliding motility-associated C-terminal domain-containing protein [Bacteroidales bacterium]
MKLRSIYIFSILLFLNLTLIKAQVTVSGALVGNGNYTSLTNTSGAFAAINAATQTASNIVITITADITAETGTNSLNAGVWTSLTIIPSGIRNISGIPAAGIPLLNLNGADRVTINGLNTTGNSLTISNTSTSSTAGTSTIRFINDASNNTITNCTILGANTAATTAIAGTILFSAGTTTGNDKNTISNNNIADAAATPSMAITSSGLSNTVSNDSISITANNISNWYSTSGANAINVLANSSAWFINSNKFYQTAVRSGLTSANYLKCISINTASGSGYTVNNNIIGFSSSAGTGMFSNNGGRFTGIDMTVAATPVSNINGNIMNNINFTTASGANSPGGAVFNGIIVNAGGVNIGTTSGNTIGATTGIATATSGIYITSTTTGTGIIPIYITSSTSCLIQNNNLGAIAAIGGATIGYSFYGIYVAGSANYSITSNVIGSITIGSISIGSVGTTTTACNLYGIYAVTSGTITIGSSGSGNIIQNLSNNSSGSGLIYAITNTGAITGVNNISYNTIDKLTFTATTSAASCYLINNTAAATTSTLNITNNSFGSKAANYTGTTGGTAAFYGINQTGTPLIEVISNNDFNNDSIKSSGVIYLINNAFASPANGSKSILNNTVTTAFTRTVAGLGTFNCYYDNGVSPNSSSITISGNNFSNINANTIGAYSFFGIYNSSSTTNPLLTVSNNTLNNITFNGNSTIFIICLNGFGGSLASPNQVYGNTVSNFSSSGTGALYGLYIGSQGLYVNVYNNTIQNFSLSGASSIFYGIFSGGTANVNNFYNNTIKAITNTSSGTVYGAYISGGATMNFYKNAINTLSTAGDVHGFYISAGTSINIYQHQTIGVDNYSLFGLTSSGTTKVSNGITVNGATTVNIYKNNIYNLSNSGIGTTATLVNGMLLSAGTTVNAFNNTIGSLTAPSANYTDAIRGISVTSTSSSSFNLYYNTIYLNSTSTGTNFGSTGVFHTANSISTTSKLDLRNNIIVNTSTPTGTAFTVAYRLSGATLANYASTSNNNLFYVGAGAKNVILYDGTGSYQTLTVYKTAVTPRDALSISELPNWVSTTGSNSTYLHINPAIANAIDNGAVNVATYIDDIDGNIRQGNTGYTGSGTAPDIGADEFDLVCTGTPATSTINGSGNLCIGSSTTLSLSNVYNSPGITYQWKSSAISGGPYSNLGTASSQLTGSLTATTYYICTITCTNSGLFSTTAMATVTVSPIAVGGTATASLAVLCAGSGTSVTLSGYTGSIQWQSSLNGVNWNNITGGTTAIISTGNLSNSTYYRAVVNSGICTPDTSNNVMVTVNPTTVAGVINGLLTVCSGTNSTLLTLTGNVGTVLKWQSSTDGITWTDIVNSSNNYTATNLTTTTQYRAIVQSGICAAANNNAVTITVVPAVITGTINGATTVCSGTNSTLLTLTAYVGNIVKWQFSTDGILWTDINNTTNSYTATNLTLTTQYRAVVQSGVCNPANSAVVTITVSTATIGGTVTGGVNVCSGTNNTLLTLTGNVGTVLKWQSSTDGITWTDIINSTTSFTATNLTITTQYRAVVQNSVCSPSNSTPATITVNPTNVGGTLSHDTTFCSTTNSILLTLNGNVGSVLRWESSTNGVIWTPISNTVTTYTANNISVTTYYRVVVQSGACSPANSTIVTITINTIPVANITGFTNPTACNLSNGTATVSPATSYHWNTTPVQTTSTASGLAAGTYFVTISNGQCSSTTSVTLNDPGAPIVTLVSNDTTICSGTLVNFTAGGATNYEFFVNGISQGIPSTTATYSSSSLSNGSIVTVRGKTGSCTGNSSGITILISPFSNGGVLGGATTVCANSNSTILTLNSYTGVIVRWEFSLNGTSWTSLVNTLNTYTANNLSVTTYYRAVVQSGNCNPANSSVAIITVMPLPSATIAYTGTPFCTSMSPVNVTQTGTTSGVYSSTNGLTINSSTGTITPSTSTAGAYTVNYTIPAAYGCPVYTASTPLTITTAPTATINYTGNPFCKSISTAQAVIQTGVTGGKYTALPSGLVIDSLTGAITPSSSNAGSYVVSYTISAAGGCAAFTATKTVVITSMPTVAISFSGTPYCKSLTTAQGITLTGTTGGSFSAIPSGLNINSSSGAIIPSSSNAGVYTVTDSIAAAGGCPLVTAVTSVTITTAPSATINYTGTPFCKTLSSAQPVTLTGTAGGKYSALPIGLKIDSITGAITPSLSVSGSYTVSYTILAYGGCAAFTTTKTVVITTLPTATITYAGTPFCKSITTAQVVTLTGTTGGSFSASPIGLSINNSTGAITPSTSTAGVYSVTDSIYAAGGCPLVTATTSVTIVTAPSVTITYAGSPFCKTLTTAQTITLTGTTGGIFSASPTGLSFNTSTAAIIPSTSTAGIYTVKDSIPAANGCPAYTTTTSVTITTPPTATISYTGTPFCKSLTTAQLVTRTGTAGGTYTALPAGLSINASTGSITPSTSTAGVYTVTYTIAASGGCLAFTTTTSVTITTAPNATINYSGSPYCNTLVTPQAVTRTGTIGGKYTVLPVGLILDSVSGAVTPALSVAGTYIVSYSIPASGGCASFTTTDTVIITTLPVASISYAGSPFCTSVVTPQPVTFSGTIGGTYSVLPLGLSLNSSTGAVTPSTTNPVGVFTVSYLIAASGGCPAVTATTSVTVTQQPLLNVASNSPVCEQDSLYLLSSNIAGANYSWTGPNTFSSLLQNPLVSTKATSAMNGVYVLNVTGISGGCPDMTANVTVDVNPKPLANFTYSPSYPESNEEINFTYTGTTATSWSWIINNQLISNVENPAFSIINFGNTLLTLQVQNNFGCKDEINRNIFVKEAVNIWVPNAFSPNGDGFNEKFNISSADKIANFNLKILNRWGQILFETNYVDEGWDGKFKNEECPIGTYVVKITYKQIQINRFFEINKSFTLIR